MQLSIEVKTVCEFFIVFLKSTSNLERFEKSSLVASIVLKLLTPKNVFT